MNVTVYHALNMRDSLFYKEDGAIYNGAQALAAFKSNGYEKVGEFSLVVQGSGDNTGILNRIYAKTQNIHEAWNSVKPCRSTSVGDIIQLGDMLYIVASCGFDELA